MVARLPQEIWEAALGDIQLQVSKPNYRTWFEKTVGLSFQGNDFVVGVPNTFAAEYLDKNQRSLIEKVLIGFTSPDVRVDFHVNGRRHSISQSQNTDNQAAETCCSQLNPRYNFDSFIEGLTNRMARAAALAVVQNPGKSYNPLFICGAAGLGKTHLLHAIGQAALGNRVKVIYASAEQFTNEFISSIRERSTESFRNRYRGADMLLIDDIQFICGKEQTEEGFFHTFNELHNASRQIVVTSDRLPKSIPLLEERLRSRFEWGLVVNIKPPDAETRLAILQAKARQIGVNIEPAVLQFLAGQVQGNVRELEGALNRVIAYARLLGQTPTIELASRALEPVTSKEPQSTHTPTLLIEAVAESFKLTPADLSGRKRDKDTTLARRLAMYLIRQETNCSVAQIGQEFGGRDAAAVTNACKSIAGDLESNSYLKRKIQDIQQKLRNNNKS
ncbi:MAG: chromosomal replication initiator protein DnaA [Dehalococcoidales bacterium]|nr:chromosomal replication initiator protein DnaA [Dehalococcoidales bacterium]